MSFVNVGASPDCARAEAGVNRTAAHRAPTKGKLTRRTLWYIALIAYSILNLSTTVLSLGSDHDSQWFAAAPVAVSRVPSFDT